MESLFSITFHTNLNNYGPFGYISDPTKAIYSLSKLGMDGGLIVGFHGIEDGWSLHGLGVFVARKES